MGEGFNAETVDAEGSPAWLGVLALLSVGGLVFVGALGLHHVSRLTINSSTGTQEVQTVSPATSPAPALSAPPPGAPLAPTEPIAGCQLGTVTFTGQYAVAKVRIAPDGEQVGYAQLGVQLVVCDVALTPGENIPNRWRRINGGPYDQAWIHEEVLLLSDAAGSH